MYSMLVSKNNASNSSVDEKSDNGLTPVISLSDVKKRFGYGDAVTFALDGVDLTVQKGEFVAIMGPSGCGKTTLLNIIGLLDKPNSGEYLLNNKSIAKISANKKTKIRNHAIGFVFQNYNLIDKLTVIDNVALPLTYSRGMQFRHLQKASKLLAKFELQNREYYFPYQLSGGQNQRVAIARALINNPSIILADEPTGNLDSKNSEIIMDELTNIHRAGNTILMVTHNPALLSYASRVIHMKDGKIARDVELVENPAHRTTERTKFVSRRKRSQRKFRGNRSRRSKL